jgi:hypothetical protein
VVEVFACPSCGQLVFFANDRCVRCGTELAFDADALRLVVPGPTATHCANREVAACNWLTDDQPLCPSCRLTRTRPADDDPEGLARFATAEAAKRRLVFQLRSLGLRLDPRDEERGTGVAFDLLSSEQEPVTTGHAGGVITLDLAESDDVHREKVRTLLHEPYRTVLGHFRHEIGHYLFPVLVGDDDLAEARERFGDETIDYQAALDRHYEDGPPSDWQRTYVSEYATMHPAEDFAETVAHYLHIRGALQVAAAYRLRVDGPPVAPDPSALESDPAALDPSSIEAIVATWLPLSYALNAVNRTMGEDDLYPFVLSPAVIDKLGFVHRLVRRAPELPSRPAARRS